MPEEDGNVLSREQKESEASISGCCFTSNALANLRLGADFIVARHHLHCMNPVILWRLKETRLRLTLLIKLIYFNFPYMCSRIIHFAESCAASGKICQTFDFYVLPHF